MEHDDLVLVCALIHHMPQGQQLLLVGQHSTPPGRVTLVADHHFPFKGLDGLIEHGRVFILVWASELVLREAVCLWSGGPESWSPGWCAHGNEAGGPQGHIHLQISGSSEWMEATSSS